MKELKPINKFCPICGSGSYMRSLEDFVAKNDKLRIKCINCNAYFTIEEIYGKPQNDKTKGEDMIKVTCELKDYSEPAKQPIRVHSHWNYRNLVELEVNGERYTVAGSDLIEAVKNCMNTNK